MKVADIILEPLGGNKFLAMTGAKNLLADGNTLRITLPKNYSRANRLWITLNGDDTYTIDFFRFTAGRLNRRTYQWTEDKKESVKVIKGVYCDMLPSGPAASRKNDSARIKENIKNVKELYIMDT